MRALFAPAAGPEIGGGHVLRDLALSAALQARGWRCRFLVPVWGGRLVRRFAASPPPAIVLRSPEGALHDLQAAVEAFDPDLLVLDDYSMDAASVGALARPGRVRLWIDDRADRPTGGEMLLDSGHGRSAPDYAALVPPGCTVLAGPAYALLRPQFSVPGAERAADGPLRRVFVSFGLGDVEGVTARAVERLRPLAPHARFDVALGADAPSLGPLCALAAADPAVRLHPDAPDVAELMRSADAAVGAGGGSTWERCALALPTLAVIVAENQRPTITGLASAGALIAVDLHAAGFEAALEAGFRELAEPSTRRRLAAASRGVCDGRGAVRVAEAIERRLSAAGTPGS